MRWSQAYAAAAAGPPEKARRVGKPIGVQGWGEDEPIGGR